MHNTCRTHTHEDRMLRLFLVGALGDLLIDFDERFLKCHLSNKYINCTLCIFQRFRRTEVHKGLIRKLRVWSPVQTKLCG